ncbi:HIT family protein [Brevundimonas sp.]|uniref:HIT family protein n=1 Tax=Brevundimonas sp. TaxID=1871086 RepID=UPI003FA57C55
MEGRKPAFVIYDTRAVVAFLDAQPTAPGHALIVPRRRAPGLLQVDADTWREVFEAARLIARAQSEALGAEGVRLLQSNGRAAGQSVFHLHLHVVPSWGPSAVPPTYTPAEVATVLRNALRASFPTAGDETPP